MAHEIITNITCPNKWEGYQIHTNQQIISIGFGDGGGCCSVQGIITTEDTLTDFIGAVLLGIEMIDMDYQNHPLTKDFEWGEGGEMCFVDINTSKGKLQFALYNDHNGYYGVEVKVNSQQLQFQKTI